MSNRTRMSAKEFIEYMKDKGKGLSSKEKELYNRSLGVKSGKRKRKVNYGGRGLRFEAVIEASNEYYKDKGYAIIRKIPTPVKVLKINSRNGRVEDGFFEKKSALDFNGLIKGGVHIDFDTKETKNKTSFPFGNISDHQFEYMRNVSELGGVSFFLVNFRYHDEVYVLRYQDIKEYLDIEPGKKSIPYEYVRTRLKENKVEKRAFNQGYIYDYLPKVVKMYK